MIEQLQWFGMLAIGFLWGYSMGRSRKPTMYYGNHNPDETGVNNMEEWPKYVGPPIKDKDKTVSL